MDKGFESFKGPDGVVRIRLTPDGARAIGEEELARGLEECKAGRHLFLNETVAFCFCGERRAP